MKRFEYKGKNWIIAESVNEAMQSLFTESHSADCYVEKAYKNRVDVCAGAMRFSVTKNRVFVFRNKESRLWYFATEGFFGKNSPFNQWGLAEKFWDALCDACNN